MKKIIQLPALIFMLCACTTSSNPTESPTKSQTTFEITSPAFANGAAIPADHTCKGIDKSPVLAWTESPGGATGYHGPCPPSGTHHYFFKLYALDTTLSLANDANKDTLLAAMQGHILANAELMGTFAINP